MMLVTMRRAGFGSPNGALEIPDQIVGEVSSKSLTKWKLSVYLKGEPIGMFNAMAQ